MSNHLQLPMLDHSLPEVSAPDGRHLYGGSQNLLPRKNIRDSGCGLISSANLLAYLTRFHGLRDGLAGVAVDVMEDLLVCGDVG